MDPLERLLALLQRLPPRPGAQPVPGLQAAPTTREGLYRRAPRVPFRVQTPVLSPQELAAAQQVLARQRQGTATGGGQAPVPLQTLLAAQANQRALAGQAPQQERMTGVTTAQKLMSDQLGNLITPAQVGTTARAARETAKLTAEFTGIPGTLRTMRDIANAQAPNAWDAIDAATLPLVVGVPARAAKLAKEQAKRAVAILSLDKRARQLLDVLPEARALEGAATKAQMQKFGEAVSVLQKSGITPQVLASGVAAGAEGRGWWKGVEDAVFKSIKDEGDRVRFANTLASFSTRTNVMRNTEYAQTLWKWWKKAGRPEVDGFALNQLFRHGLMDAMDSHAPNAARALRGETLSGPKVSQMGNAILGDVNASVLDVWMARIVNWAQSALGGRSVGTGRMVRSVKDGKLIPEKVALADGDYLALEAMIGETANTLRIEPREAQEMLWTFIKSVEPRLVGKPKQLRVTQASEESDMAKLLTGSPRTPIPFVGPSPDPEHLRLIERNANLNALGSVRRGTLTPQEQANAAKLRASLTPEDKAHLRKLGVRGAVDGREGAFTASMMLGLTGMGAGGLAGAGLAGEDASEAERLQGALFGAGVGAGIGAASLSRLLRRPTRPVRPRSAGGFREVTPEAFARAVDDFSAARPSERGFLTMRTPQQMQAEGMRVFLSRDGKTGFALAPLGDGRVDIRNVFNMGAKGEGSKAIAEALARGGNVLDHFDTRLGDIYRRFGFEEYVPPGEVSSRLKFADEYAPEGWDFEKYGRPDVVYQRHPASGLTAEQYLERYRAAGKPSAAAAGKAAEREFGRVAPAAPFASPSELVQGRPRNPLQTKQTLPGHLQHGDADLLGIPGGMEAQPLSRRVADAERSKIAKMWGVNLSERGAVGAGGRRAGITDYSVELPRVEYDNFTRRNFRSGLEDFILGGEFGRQERKSLQQWEGRLLKNIGKGYTREELEASGLLKALQDIRARSQESGAVAALANARRSQGLTREELLDLASPTIYREKILGKSPTFEEIQERLKAVVDRYGNRIRPRPRRTPSTRFTEREIVDVPGTSAFMQISAKGVKAQYPRWLRNSTYAEYFRYAAQNPVAFEDRLQYQVRQIDALTPEEAEDVGRRYFERMLDDNKNYAAAFVAANGGNYSAITFAIRDTFDEARKFGEAVRNAPVKPKRVPKKKAVLGDKPEDWVLDHETPVGEAIHSRWVPKGDKGINYREHVITLPYMEGNVPRVEAHFDEPGVAVFARTTDEPGRVLRVQELQSDWQRVGRMRGWETPEWFAEREVLRREYTKLQDELENFEVVGPASQEASRRHLEAEQVWDRLAQSGIQDVDALSAHPEYVAALKRQREAELLARNERVQRRATRDALEEQVYDLRVKLNEGEPVVGLPFNREAQGWIGAGMKVMLDRAANSGYDVLRWNSGATSADIYGLHQIADELVLTRPDVHYNPESRRANLTVRKNGQTVKHLSLDDEEELAEYVGEDVAKALRTAPKDPDTDVRVLRGEELDVGGRHHKMLYDEIMPGWMESYLRKLGFDDIKPRRVGTKDKGSYWEIPITPALRERIKTGGQLFPVLIGGAAVGWSHLSPEDQQLVGAAP
jgi:hypothetical protein